MAGQNIVLFIVETALPWLVVLAILIGVIRRFWRDRLSKTIKVKASVIDKISDDYQAVIPNGYPHTRTDYILVFSAGNRVLRFMTSVWIFDSVKKGDTGTLKYKGNRLISFE